MNADLKYKHLGILLLSGSTIILTALLHTSPVVWCSLINACISVQTDR